MQTIAPHVALIYVMTIVAAADGAISARELKAMGDLVRTAPAFAEFEVSRLASTTKECADLLREPEGYETVQRLIGESLPHQLRETAYWFALEVALSDRSVALEEVRVLDDLRQQLRIDKLVSAALERAARARFHSA